METREGGEEAAKKEQRSGRESAHPNTPTAPAQGAADWLAGQGDDGR